MADQLFDTKDRLTDARYFGHPSTGGGGGGTGTVTGTGVVNTIAKWTAGSAIGNSGITDDGTTVTSSRVFALQNVNSTTRFKGPMWDKGGRVYDIRSYGAVGQNTAADTAGIDAAWAAAIAGGGGVVYVPEGNWFYEGTGLVNYPGAATYTPVWLAGNGLDSTTIVIVGTGISSPHFIKIGTSLAPPNGKYNNTGGGIRDLTVSFVNTAAATTDFALIENNAHVHIQNVRTYSGRDMVTLGDGWGYVIDNCYFEGFYGTGLDIKSEQYSAGGVISRNFFICEGGGGYGIKWAKTTSVGGEGYIFISNAINGTCINGVLMSAPTLTQMTPFFSELIFDGTASGPGVLMQNVKDCFFSELWSVCHGAGAVALELDGTMNARVTGGTLYYGHAGTLVSLKNATLLTNLSKIEMSGAGVCDAFLVDGTTHTEVSIDVDTDQCVAVGDISNLIPSVTGVHLLGGLTKVSSVVFESLVSVGNSATIATIDWSLGNKQTITTTNNCTLTFTDPKGPCNLVLKVIHDATANTYTYTWPSSVAWVGGGTPTTQNTAGAVDIVSFFFDGTHYYGGASIVTSGGSVGPGTSGYLSVFTSASAIGSSPIYSDGTNIGLGTSTPASKLHVVGTITGTEDALINGNTFGTGAGSGGGLSVAIGDSALAANTTGQDNVGIGYNALLVNDTGENNVALGTVALVANVSGDRNTVIGAAAGKDLISGGDNTFVGYYAGGGVTTGVENTVIGANALGLAAGLSNHVIITDGTGVAKIVVDGSGVMKVAGTPSYATNGDALTAGLTAGCIYAVTGSDPLQLAIVY